MTSGRWADAGGPRGGPPCRAEPIGSLLRPRTLQEAARARAAGRLDEAAYQRALADAVRAVVARQEALGLPVVTDGELGRRAWSTGFLDAVAGLAYRPSLFPFTDAGGGQYGWDTCYATARLRRARPAAVVELRRVQPLTARVVKVTLPAPSMPHFFRFADFADRAVYPDEELFWEDLLAVYRAEVADLVTAGCRYLQLDEVPLAMLGDEGIRARVRALGGDPGALAERYLEALNRVAAACPPTVTVGVHFCRGNFRSRWMAVGGYDWIALRVFPRLAVDALCLEYDSPRAGTFAPLAEIPAGPRVLLGLVSTKTPALEGVDVLRRRLDEAARHLPLERLGLSPQCGFASVAGGNLLDEDAQWAKLGRVVEVARLVWGEEATAPAAAPPPGGRTERP